MVSKKVIKTADEEMVLDLKATEKGMSGEAKEAFLKRVVECHKMGKKSSGSDDFEGRVIDILAMGPSRGQCRYDVESWGLNTSWKQTLATGHMLNKLFILHTQVFSDAGNPYFIWEQLNQMPFEIINIHRIKGLKAKIFPLKRISKKFDADYFSDTICYMIAYALDQHTYIDKKDPLFPNGKVKLHTPLMLRLYGVDLQDFNEYQLEKGGIEFWLGWARGLGVEYTISFGSTLLTTLSGKPYGVKAYHKKDIIPDEWKGKKLYQGGKLQGDDFLQREIQYALSRRLQGHNTEA